MGCLSFKRFVWWLISHAPPPSCQGHLSLSIFIYLPFSSTSHLWLHSWPLSFSRLGRIWRVTTPWPLFNLTNWILHFCSSNHHFRTLKHLLLLEVYDLILFSSLCEPGCGKYIKYMMDSNIFEFIWSMTDAPPFS